MDPCCSARNEEVVAFDLRSSRTTECEDEYDENDRFEATGYHEKTCCCVYAGASTFFVKMFGRARGH